MPHYRKLAGEKCYLSPVDPADAAAWAVWLNDLAVTVPLGDEAYCTLTLEGLQAGLAEASRRQEPMFSIVDCATDQVIGRCLLFGVNPVDRCANLGILIGEAAYRGRGFGTEAVCLLLDYAFNLLNLHSVMLGAFAFNERAIRTYQKVGFQIIGRRRDARIIGGRAYDGILMDILEDEFRARWPTRLNLPA